MFRGWNFTILRFYVPVNLGLQVIQHILDVRKISRHLRSTLVLIIFSSVFSQSLGQYLDIDEITVSITLVISHELVHFIARSLFYRPAFEIPFFKIANI